MGLAVRSSPDTSSSALEISAPEGLTLTNEIKSSGPTALFELGKQLSALVDARVSLIVSTLNFSPAFTQQIESLAKLPGEKEFTESCLTLQGALEKRRLLVKKMDDSTAETQRLEITLAQRGEELTEFAASHPEQSAFDLKRTVSVWLKAIGLGPGPDDEFSKVKAKADEAKAALKRSEHNHEHLLKKVKNLDTDLPELTTKCIDLFFSRLIVDRSELEREFWRISLGPDPTLDHDQIGDSIFTFLNRQSTADQILTQAKLLSKLVAPEISETISCRAIEIVDSGLIPGVDDDAYGAPLNLASLPAEMFTGLSDLEHWSELKNSPEVFGLFPPESVAKAETVVVNKIFERLLELEKIGESDTETLLRQISVLGSPEAIKPLFGYIKASPECEESNLAFCAAKEIAAKIPKSGNIETINSLTASEQELLKMLVNEDSFANRFRCSGSQFCQIIRNPAQALAYEELCAILSKTGLEQGKAQEFYLKQTGANSKELVAALLTARAALEQAIVSHPGRFWQEKFEKLLAALSDPQHGDISGTFMQIVKTGLGLTSPELLTAFGQLLTSKSFLKSNFERQSLLEGLLYLSTKKDGGEVLQILLSRYRGSAKDGPRIRAIIQELATLDELGAFGLSMPDPDKIRELEAERAELKEAILQEQNKVTRKQYKDRIEGIDNELSELHGLAGIERAMQERAAEVTWKVLKLPSLGGLTLGANLAKLKEQGFFEIIPTLAGNLEAGDHEKSKKLLAEVTRHILLGDFQEWKYSHELAQAQLHGLGSAQAELWAKSQSSTAEDPSTTYRAIDTDDPLKLLRVGAEPVETCQSWRDGCYIECLLAYVADSNKRLVQIVDQSGQVVLRSVIKLVKQIPVQYGESVGQPVSTILIEKQYGASANPEVQSAFIQLLIKKALALNLPLTVGDDFDEPTIQIFEQEAKQWGYSWIPGRYKIAFPESLNQDEYSDLLDGPLSQHDNTCTVSAHTLCRYSRSFN